MVKNMKQIVITNLENKKHLLETSFLEKTLHPYKFMTEREVMEHLYFSYDKRAVYYLMKKYHLKVENAMMYLENMYYIDDEVNDEKVVSLRQLKEELLRENLLILDPLFPIFLKDSTILYHDYLGSEMTPRIKKDLRLYAELKEENKNVVRNENLSVCCFETIPDEVNYVAHKICELHEANIPFSKIKLVNAHTEYLYDLKRIFAYYHIPVMLEEKKAILATSIVNEFLSRIQELPLLDLLLELQEKYKSGDDQEILNQIITCLNQYSWCDSYDEEIIEMLVYDFSHTYKKQVLMKDCVCLEDLFAVGSDDYVFFIGMNADTVPMVKKDETYLNDALKEKLSLFTVKDWNKEMRKQTILKISSLSHVYLSYKKQSKTKESYPSSILEEMHIKQVENVRSNISYSRLEEQLELACAMDQYRKYGAVTSGLKKYYFLLPNLPYQTYQNQYRPIKSDKIKDYFLKQGGLTLSYSSIDHYMKCKFRYYLDVVLKLNIYEENFKAIIGSYYHALLEKKDQADFDFEKETELFFKDKELSNREQFLLIKLKEELRDILKITDQFESYSKFQDKSYEARIEISKDCDIPVTVKGFIDKVMRYKDATGSYISLIDYKTGGYDASLNHVYHGLGLQLPIYAYLAKYSKQWKDDQLVGFYIAPILVAEELQKDNSSVYDKKREKMRFVGYSINDENILEKFDTTYQNSLMIRGMKITSKGFGPYAKVLKKEEIEKLVVYIDQLISKTITNILEGDFSIHPKILKGKNMSCSFCPYEEICYKKYDDFVELEEKNYKDFLGGEEVCQVGQKNS